MNNSITNTQVSIIVANNSNDSLSFKLIVQKVEYLLSTKILNDGIKPNRKIFYCLVLPRIKRWALNAEGDITLIYRPERLDSHRISSSLNRYILNVFTHQIHLPPVRANYRLTKAKKYIVNASPTGDDLPWSEDSAGRGYCLTLVKRESARQVAIQGTLTSCWGKILDDSAGAESSLYGEQRTRLGPSVAVHPHYCWTQLWGSVPVQLTCGVSCSSIQLGLYRPSKTLTDCHVFLARWASYTKYNVDRYTMIMRGSQMFEKIEEIEAWLDVLTITRANEVLYFVNLLGAREWAWFLVGFILSSLFLASGRIAQLLPDEKAWVLTALQSLALIICYALLGAFISIWGYAFFAFVGDEMAWQAQNITRFWLLVENYKIWSVYGFLIGIVTGGYARIIIARSVEPWVAEYLHSRTILSTLTNAKYQLTDADTVSHQLPSIGEKIDHYKFFNMAKKHDDIFFGMGTDNKPVSISRDNYKSKHIQIIGPSGSGKNRIANTLLVQGIEYDDAIFIINPKKDEWGKSTISQACEKAGKTFSYIDMKYLVAQFNISRGSTPDELFELFVTSGKLGSKGESADFYRLHDRDAAYELSRAIKSNSDVSLPELYALAPEYLSCELMDNAKGFMSQLKEWSRIKAIQTREGVDLSSPLNNGGVIFIDGALRGEVIPQLLKMVVMRLIQLIEKRTTNRHVTVFLDEFKYLISPEIIKSFATIRDRGCNLILAHQALDDFKDCGSDLRPEVVEGGILVNTQIKIINRCADSKTAEWAAKLTGKVWVDKERRTAARNEGLAENIHSDRLLDKVEKYLIDENTMLNLHPGCALLIGADQPKLVFSQAIKTIKRQFQVIAAKPIKHIQSGQSLIRDNDFSELKHTQKTILSEGDKKKGCNEISDEKNIQIEGGDLL